jgi:predicted Zn-dependent protease with MMP-like domain
MINKLDSEFMEIGKEPNKFIIKKGSIIQLKNKDEWYNSVCIVEYIMHGVAYLFSLQHQDWGLYKLGIWNCENVIQYNYNN